MQEIYLKKFASIEVGLVILGKCPLTVNMTHYVKSYARMNFDQSLTLLNSSLVMILTGGLCYSCLIGRRVIKMFGIQKKTLGKVVKIFLTALNTNKIG